MSNVQYIVVWLFFHKYCVLNMSAVECRNPFIANGYTDLSPPPADDEYLVGTTNQLSKSYNESLQVW